MTPGLAVPARPWPTAAFMNGRGRLDALPVEHHLLARTLMAQPELFAFGSMQQVCRRCEATPAGILRFAQALGYSGYGSLQESVRRAHAEQCCLPTPARRPAGSGTVRRLEAVGTDHQAALDLVHRGVDPADLARAAALLLSARRRLVAAGREDALAWQLGELLRDAGLAVHPLPARLDGVGPGDAVVALPARPCHADRAAELLAGARRRGAVTLAVAPSAAGTALACASTLTLSVPGWAEDGCSLVAAAALVELLVVEVAGQSAERR